MNTEDKTCTITVHNPQGFELQEQMLTEVMSKCARHLPQAKTIEVYTAERIPADAPPYKNPGWLEWGILVTYHGGGRLMIGAIQRTPDSKFEFHT